MKHWIGLNESTINSAWTRKCCMWVTFQEGQQDGCLGRSVLSTLEPGWIVFRLKPLFTNPNSLRTYFKHCILWPITFRVYCYISVWLTHFFFFTISKLHLYSKKKNSEDASVWYLLKYRPFSLTIPRVTDFAQQYVNSS